MSLDFVLVVLVTLVVTVAFLVSLWWLPWAERAHLAQVIQAFAVVLTLALAWVQYLQYFEGDKARKKQAVIDIMRHTMGSPTFGRGYHLLYDQSKDETLGMDAKKFNENVASLSDIFWTVGACVAADQCDATITRQMFCFDFKTYEFVYNYVNKTADTRNQSFADERLAVFCACDPSHRFTGHKLERQPEQWPSICSPQRKAP